MPTYAYHCEVCNEEFEEYHSMSEKVEECPKCKAAGRDTSTPPKKLIAGSSFILVGSGWARDNYS